jgi:uncharacterized protein (TIGR02117 family)
MLFLWKAFKLLLKGLLGFVAVILLYVVCAQGLSAIRVNTEPIKARRTIPVYVRTNGVHTDILVPVKNEYINWRDTFPVSSFANVDTTFSYLAFGWGDKGFYLDTPTWDDLKASTAFKALFFMSSTAMHVTYKRNEPKENEDCVKLLISEDAYQKLCAEIAASFAREKSGIQRIDHPGYGEHDNFYEAIGTYSFLKTCNVWTGRCLKNSTITIGYWTPFDWNVMHSLRNY